MDKIALEIAYTPGRLARKIGISKSALMKHLRVTELIKQCWVTEGGHWRIPYSVAVQISSAEALTAMPRTERPGRRKRKSATIDNRQSTIDNPFTSFEGKPGDRRQGPPTQPIYHEPNYREIGKALSRTGITLPTLARYLEQQMEVTNERQEDNFAKRDDGKGDKP